MRAISKLSSTPQRNKLSTVLEVIANYFENSYNKIPNRTKELGGITNDDELLKIRLKSYLRIVIRQSWRKYDTSVDEFINPTNCFKDIKGPQEEGEIFNNRPRECEKSEYKCIKRKNKISRRLWL